MAQHIAFRAFRVPTADNNLYLPARISSQIINYPLFRTTPSTKSARDNVDLRFALRERFQHAGVDGCRRQGKGASQRPRPQRRKNLSGTAWNSGKRVIST